MSKSAGTLITTHNATYVHPRFMPGYTGYVPTIKFDQGETYGNLTCKYFNDFRLKGLESSRLNHNRGGYFPSIYSSDGNLACEARGRSWERWARMPVYRLTIQDRATLKRQTMLLQRMMAHREHYKDSTGTVPKVEYFNIPKNCETREMFAAKPKFSVTCTHPGVSW